MRRFTILILLLFVFFLTSCTTSAGGGPHDVSDAPGQTGTAAPRTGPDFDNRFGRGYANLIETEDAYYYADFNGSYIYYYDKASGERGVLCAKPECLHDAANNNTECNGYAGLHARSLNLWGGRLHYVSFDHDDHDFGTGLFSVSLDGSSKSRDVKLELGEMDKIQVPERFDYHRGMLYSRNQYKLVKNGEPQDVICVLRYDPDTGDMKELYRVADTNAAKDLCLFYYENYVYFSVCDWSAYASGKEENYMKIEIFRWNIDTEQLETVFSTGDNGLTCTMFNIWVESEDRIYIVPVEAPDGAPVYLLSGGEITTAFEFDSFGATLIVDGAVVCIFPHEAHAEIRALPDGALIYEGDWDMDPLNGLDVDYEIAYLLAVYGDSETLFVTYGLDIHDKGDTHGGSCLVRYDLSGDKPEATLIAYSPWD